MPCTHPFLVALTAAALAPLAAAGAPDCHGVNSTSELLDAISERQPEVCLFPGDYHVALDLRANVSLTSIVRRGARLIRRPEYWEYGRVVRVRSAATVTLSGLVIQGGTARDCGEVCGEHCGECGGEGESRYCEDCVGEGQSRTVVAGSSTRGS